MFDLAAALGTGQPFLGHAVKRQCGVLLIAAEGADEVRLRLDAVVRDKCGDMERAPFRWYETAPMLLQKGAVETLIAMARQADASLQQEFGLPLGLIVIDTIAACAGYARAGDENDPAAGQAVMNVLKAVAQALGCFVLGVDHFGKNLEAGTRGASSKESCRRSGAGLPGRQGAQRQRHQHTGWRCGRTGAASRARNIPSRCASWRRRSRTRTASRSPPWWWIGSRRRQAGRSRSRIRGRKPATGSAHGGAAAEAGADGRPGRAGRRAADPAGRAGGADDRSGDRAGAVLCHTPADGTPEQKAALPAPAIQCGRSTGPRSSS